MCLVKVMLVGVCGAATKLGAISWVIRLWKNLRLNDLSDFLCFSCS